MDKYFIYYNTNEGWGSITDLEIFDSIDLATEFINQAPHWEYTIIKGQEVKAKPVEIIKKLEIEA